MRRRPLVVSCYTHPWCFHIAGWRRGQLAGWRLRREDRSSAVVDFFAPRKRTRLRTRTVVVCRLRMEPLLFLKTLPKGVQIGLSGLVLVSLSTTSTLTCASQVATDPDWTLWNGLVCASGFACSSRNPSIVL